MSEPSQPNGCGGKGGWVDPPEFVFHDSCNDHDISYSVGGTEADRKNADEAFYREMKRAAAKAPWYAMTFLYSQAWIYYKAVRLFGGKFFNYKR